RDSPRDADGILGGAHRPCGDRRHPLGLRRPGMDVRLHGRTRTYDRSDHRAVRVTPATLSEAITWTQDHWAEQRPAPIRLHTRDNQGLGPFFTPAFAAALDGSVDAV